MNDEETKTESVTEWIQPETLITSTNRQRNEANCKISKCEWQYYEKLPPSQFDPYAFQVNDFDRLHIKKCHHDR